LTLRDALRDNPLAAETGIGPFVRASGFVFQASETGERGTLMRSHEWRARRLTHLSALAVVAAVGFFGQRSGADVVESWDEKSGGGSGVKAQSAPVKPSSGSGATPAPKATPNATAAPKKTPAPTPDPKKFSNKNDYACERVKAKANEAIADIEAKREQEKQGKTVATQYPLEHEYDAAYKEAVDKLKSSNPNATAAELDEAGKKAGREAVQDGFRNGKVVDPKTGETFPDLFRRESEGANRGKPVPPPSNAVPANASPYMKECAKNGVPLPPVWGDPKWVNQGTLSKDKLIAFTDLPSADVWVSKSPLGTCFALARKDDKGEIQRLDQICQGQKSGKACFWDNTSPKDGETPLKVKDGLDPANVAGGDKMKMNCTKCHRGDNAFIIHPNTPLQLGPDDPCEKADPTSRFGPTEPDKRFQPIGRKRDPKISGDPEDQAGFENPTDGAYEDLGDGPCSACHGIPKLTYSYCAHVLDPILVKGTMPPVPPPPAPTPNPADYAKEIEKLKNACIKVMNENLAE
jgi:hypothetical protein